MKRFVLPLTVTALLLLASLLVFALVDLEPAPVRLPLLVGEHLDASGVRHPVTAVLLNFRGYDTLGETTVVFTAGAGIIALLRRRKKENSNDSAGKAQGRDGA